MKFRFDSNNLIVQTNGDGGDSAARTALYYLLNMLLGNDLRGSFCKFISSIQVFPGSFVRNPVKYNDPKDFSRDQEDPVVMALGFFPSTKLILKLILWNRIRRFGFYQNKDFSNPSNFGMLFRSLHWWWFYPFLIFSDLFLLFNSLIICFWKTKVPGPILNYLGKYWWGFVDDSPPNPFGVEQDRHGPGNVGSDINHSLSLIQAYHFMPTPVSLIARKIYVAYRPLGPQGAWNMYFSPMTGANPFNELARPIIKEIL